MHRTERRAGIRGVLPQKLVRMRMHSSILLVEIVFLWPLNSYPWVYLFDNVYIIHVLQKGWWVVVVVAYTVP